MSAQVPPVILMLDNDWIQFSARFGGVHMKYPFQSIGWLPFLRGENGQGLHFEPVDASTPPPDQPSPEQPAKRLFRLKAGRRSKSSSNPANLRMASL